MSLLRPTPGEMWDRVTILRVKIRHGKEEGKNVSHFEEELKSLFDPALRSFQQRVPIHLLEELEKTNEAIWPLIETSPPELLRLNKQRMALREHIDMLCGECKGPEKV